MKPPGGPKIVLLVNKDRFWDGEMIDAKLVISNRNKWFKYCNKSSVVSFGVKFHVDEQYSTVVKEASRKFIHFDRLHRLMEEKVSLTPDQLVEKATQTNVEMPLKCKIPFGWPSSFRTSEFSDKGHDNTRILVSYKLRPFIECKNPKAGKSGEPDTKYRYFTTVFLDVLSYLPPQRTQKIITLNKLVGEDEEVVNALDCTITAPTRLYARCPYSVHFELKNNHSKKSVTGISIKIIQRYTLDANFLDPSETVIRKKVERFKTLIKKEPKGKGVFPIKSGKEGSIDIPIILNNELEAVSTYRGHEVSIDTFIIVKVKIQRSKDVSSILEEGMISILPPSPTDQLDEFLWNQRLKCIREPIQEREIDTVCRSRWKKSE